MNPLPWLAGLFAAVILMPSLWGGDQGGTYVNQKYRYVIAYPSGLFRPLGESDAGDGQRFAGVDGKSELIVYAFFNVLDQDLSDLYQEALNAQGRETTYKAMKGNWFVVSGYEAGKIYYHKTFFSDGAFYTFELSYDPEVKAIYDPLVSRISASFRIFEGQ